MESRRSIILTDFWFFRCACFTIKEHYEQSVKYCVEKFGAPHPVDEEIVLWYRWCIYLH